MYPFSYSNERNPSLRTADVFPVVFQKERSDDRKYVCGSQARETREGGKCPTHTRLESLENWRTSLLAEILNGGVGILGQPRCSFIQNLKSKILQCRDYHILPQGPNYALPKLWKICDFDLEKWFRNNSETEFNASCALLQPWKIQLLMEI